MLDELGKMPLPPYIHEPLYQSERYQTVYASSKGSVAAPTAGLHFTPLLLKSLEDKGITLCFVTLHIGLDTFRPVREDEPINHIIHTEHGEVSSDTAALLNEAKKAGRRIIAVGTSTVRLIEAAAQSGRVVPHNGPVNMFILPGYEFRTTDGMLTNFHLPRSTLIMLVSAFAGKELIMNAYEQAIAREYRFYSFGDAMLIL
jgi:S-adenosylmethionine:tRNA ribosyltransferase-isomerase